MLQLDERMCCDADALPTDSAGPGGTSLRSTRGRGRPAAVHKTGKASGDVTVAATYVHPAVRCHCFEVLHIELYGV